MDARQLSRIGTAPPKLRAVDDAAWSRIQLLEGQVRHMKEFIGELSDYINDHYEVKERMILSEDQTVAEASDREIEANEHSQAEPPQTIETSLADDIHFRVKERMILSEDQTVAEAGDRDIEVNEHSRTEQPQTIEISPPEDIHFLSGFILLQDEKLDSRICYSCATLAIVLLQLVATISLVVTMGNLNGLCHTPDECGRASWCTATLHPRSGTNIAAGRCLYCVSADENELCWLNGTAKNPVLWATQQKKFRLATRSKLPRPVEYHLTTTDHQAMCDQCLDGAGLVRGIPADITTTNLTMGVREWLVYIFISLTASMVVAREASDWYKNVIILHRAAPNHWHSALQVHHATDKKESNCLKLAHLPQLVMEDFGVQHLKWKMKYVWLQAVQDLRAGLLGSILVTVPCFVLLDQSDAVSILVNALATFFILEVDNLFFKLYPAEQHPVRVWTTRALHMHVEDAARIEQVKALYFVMSVFGLSLIKPLGDSLGNAYLYVPAVLLNVCALASELMLCHTWGAACAVALRWLVSGFAFYWFINVFFIAFLPVVV